MRVNIFKNVMASWPQETELDKIVNMMQFSREIHLRTQLYRQFKANGDQLGAEQMKITKFPAFAPCAIFCDGKSRDDVIGLTDICYLDFDDVKDGNLLVEAMNILRNDANVLMASKSVSGEGLHILVRYKLKEIEMPPQRITMTPVKMQDLYSDVYDYLAAKYLQKLSLMPDYHAGHMERVYIVSYDPDLYYNPQAETLTIDLKEPVKDDDSLPSIMKIGRKMREAEKLIPKNRLDEAEEILIECREWFISNSCDSSKMPILDDYLSQIKTAKEVFSRVNNLMDEVDEDLRNQDTKTAHPKIVESQHLLKTITGMCKQAVGKVRKRVVANEKKMGAINREMRRKAYEEKLAL